MADIEFTSTGHGGSVMGEPFDMTAHPHKHDRVMLPVRLALVNSSILP
ncbi:MAG: hypothetical protein AB7P17_06610 [Nitrospirales bacterium]